MNTLCGWHCGDDTPDHKHYTVLCYEDGKFLGGLTPHGSANRLKIYRAIMGKDRAAQVAASINAKGEFTAKVASF